MQLSANKPLQGLRILAVEQYGAGPFCTMNLADLGAEVIKIESPTTKEIPGGDSSRYTGPHFLGTSDSHFFQTFNRNKRSLCLDIRKPQGMDILRRLVHNADAVINNLRGDQPDKLGITYDDFKDINPRLVCAHLSGYGRSGSRAKWPAYDYLAQAESGYLYLTGEPDGEPTRMGLSIVDFLTGLTTAFSVTAAIFNAYRSGTGCDIDVTLYDVAMQQLTYPATWYLNEGDVIERRPRSGHPSIVPCEIFPTKDGKLFVMCITPKFWINLCQTISMPELVEDQRFIDFTSRFNNRDALIKILDSRFVEYTTAEWISKFAGKVPIAPVLTLNQALDNPYLNETSGIVGQPHALKPDFKVIASPIKINGQRSKADAAPSLGADTLSILQELEFNSESIQSLLKEGVIG